MPSQVLQGTNWQASEPYLGMLEQPELFLATAHFNPFFCLVCCYLLT